jgi:hypothetical protein
VQHGHDADGEVAGDAAADLEEADRDFEFLVFSRYQSARSSCTRCRRARCGFFDVTLRCSGGEDVAEVLSSQPGTMMGRFFSAAASSQESFGSIW